MAFVVGIKRLKDLVIDVAKNWAGYQIKNVGSPVDATDVARKADIDPLSWYGIPTTYPGPVLVESLTERYAYATLTATYLKGFFLPNPGKYRATMELRADTAGYYNVGIEVRASIHGPVLYNYVSYVNIDTLYMGYYDDMVNNVTSAMYYYIYVRDNTSTIYIRNVKVHGIPVSRPSFAVVQS